MTLRTFALALLLTPAAAGASASELDHLVYLSWSAAGETDTLVVAGAGDHDLYLRVRADEAPALWVETIGTWYFGPGLSVKGFEVLTTGNPIGSVDILRYGYADVRVGDFDCTRGGDPYTVARFTLAVDPAAFADGSAAVVPSATGTRVTFAAFDPTYYCAGTWDYAVVTPAVVVDAAVPTDEVSFGALKARYR